MVLHCVFCAFDASSTRQDQQAILDDLEQFSLTLPGVIGFEQGPNLDFEGKSPEYNAGFVIRFRDETALHSYAKHPQHKAIGARLCALCSGGADGIIVFDIKAG